MKLLTYNLHYGGKSRTHWTEVLERVGPDIFLVQETFEPRVHLPQEQHGELQGRVCWNPVTARGKTLAWGSAVYAPSFALVPIELRSYSGWVVGAEFPNLPRNLGQSERLRVFSVHAPSGLGPYPEVVNSILDILLAYREGCEMVIGGDFNLTVGERHHSESRITELSHLKIQARLRDEFGLINAWQVANPNRPLVQTLRWESNRSIPFHCDGLFVPKSWEPQLRSCAVLSGGCWDELSDHYPVVAEFEP